MSHQILVIGTDASTSSALDATPAALAAALAASGLEVVQTGAAATERRHASITLDALRRFEASARERAVWRRFGLREGEYALVILRRLRHPDEAAHLSRLTRALAGLAQSVPVIFPARAGTKAQLAASGGLEQLSGAGVQCVEPLRYLELLSLKTAAGAILTDSARAEEEAGELQVPCFRLRLDDEQPSGPVTVESLVGPAPAPAPETPRQEILGVEIDALDMDETVAACERLIERGGFAQHVCVNVAKLMAMHRDPALREIVESCAVVSADGQPIVWASKLLGAPLPARVAGIDLMHELLALAARRGLRPYVLGARPEVLEEATQRLRERHPGLELAGSHHGYFSDDEAEAVCDEIRAAKPDMLFVAMGSPRKEYFLGRAGRSLGVPFVMGVGGAIDVAAGRTRRAPVLMQDLGLEWLYRMVQEPRRLGRRYITTNLSFLQLLGRELVRTRLRRLRPSPSGEQASV